jgi:hypothetical protein
MADTDDEMLPKTLHGATAAPMGASAAAAGAGDPRLDRAPLQVQMTRTASQATSDQALWAYIRAATNRLSFAEYRTFLDRVLCDDRQTAELRARGPRLPFPGVDSYALLKAATEVFLMKNCGIFGDPDASAPQFEAAQESARFARPVDGRVIKEEFLGYTDKDEILPYLDLIRSKLGEVPLRDGANLGVACYGILRQKLVNPCMIELLWSYWHEEGMLVQTMNAISMRFQNRRGAASRDPMANFDVDPLRPLGSFLWGYIQDEQHRLSIVRRAYEYDHHYGITLQGKAVPRIRSADSRSKFLEAFHGLLQQAWAFFKQDDDTTVVADGFPVLNALKEVHLLLTQGGHNQYGDLPWNARLEMLMQQWLLARPEMREFLSGRTMVAYVEPWMDRVDTMKALQGWTDTTVSHFRDLGVFGEQILLSARWQAWSTVFDPNQAANWARYWRPEIQAYLHAYRAVTGVELRGQGAPDAVAPSVHLRRREEARARAR